MGAYYCVWVAVDRWVMCRSASDSESTERAVGDALKMVCATPSQPHPDAGVLHGDHPGPVMPSLLDGIRPQVLHWSNGELLLDTSSGIDEVRALGPEHGATGDRLLLSVDADAVERLDARVLGEAVFRLVDNPHLSGALAGETDVLRGVTVAERSDCLLLFARGVARAAASLTPSELGEARSLLQRSVHQTTHPVGRLWPMTARFRGQAVDGEAAVTIGQGSVSVLFGRNGAGKTACITALRRFLAAEPALGGGTDVSASVMLQADEQTLAARQFALLITHLTFQPMSNVPESALRSNVKLRCWNSFRAFDRTADALPVWEVVEQPLEDLQEALATALTHVLQPLADNVSAFARLVATSPCLTMEGEGRLSLIVDATRADDEARSAAHRIVLGAQMSSGLPGLLWPLFRCAQDIVEGGAVNTIPVLSVQLAHYIEGVSIDEDSGWLQAGRELEQLLLRDLPEPVVFSPGREAPALLERLAEDAALELLRGLAGVHDDGRHPFAAYPSLTDRVTSILAEAVNDLLPRFIGESGHLRLTVADPTCWHDRRLDAAFQRAEGEEVALDNLPTGFATWVHAALVFATRRLQRARWQVTTLLGSAELSLDDPWVHFAQSKLAREVAVAKADPMSLMVTGFDSRLLFLVDEPEVHLHLTAQQDVVDVVARLARDSAGAVVATHSLAFIDGSSACTTVHTVTERGGRSSLSRASGLDALGRSAEELGIPRSALAQLYRAVLLVEGTNDVLVLRRYGGVDFDAARVLLLPMQGHAGAVNLAEAEFLQTLRIPLYVMLDAVRRSVLAQALETGNASGLRLHGEERTLLALHQSLQRTGESVVALPFAGRDIVTALPEADVDALLRGAGHTGFNGWVHLQNVAARAWDGKRTKFKDVFRAETGMDVEHLLRALRGSDRFGRSPQLVGALAAMLEHLNHPRDGAAPGLQLLKRRG